MLANHAPASNDSPQGDLDYETILTALLDTARGRSFLQEYLRRNRSDDTATLLTAITRIEGLLTAKSLEPSGPAPEAMNVEALEASTTELVIAESVVTAISLPAETIGQTDTTAIEIARTETVAANIAETDSFADEVAEDQGSAIEFLGPQPAGGATQVEATPGQDRTNVAPRDPFADFRALSDIEKIAVFT